MFVHSDADAMSCHRDGTQARVWLCSEGEMHSEAASRTRRPWQGKKRGGRRWHCPLARCVKNMHLPVGVGVAGAFLLAAGLWGQQTMPPTRGLTVITEERVRESVSYLASDLMRGRNTPSPELDSCANFLARRMGTVGLDTSLQRFNLLQARLGEQNSLMVHKDGQRFVYRLHQDFVPVHLSGNGEVEAPVAFVGYGITAPEYGYDDYQGMEVAGKVVLLFTHEPQERDTTSLFAGERETPHSSLYQKAANARAHGAVGVVLVVADPNNHTFVRPASEWASRGQMGSSPLVTLEEREGQQLVVMHIGKRMAEELVAPCGRSLSSLQTDIDTSLAPQSCVIPDVTVSMRARLAHHRLRTQNVVGVLTGGDPVLKHQVVVVGAHYDHLGARGDSLIFNGADDNASGTAGLLAIAEAFAASGTQPKRTVVFCAFAGEEKGLYGSRYYVANPHLPVRDTVAMLNMDMIGRNDTAAVEVVGADSTSWLRALTERANMAVGLRLRFRSRKVIASSDAMPFAWRGVATHTFTTGLQPSDDVERLALGHLANVARLVYITAWLLANEDLPASAMPIAAKQPHGQSSVSGSSRQ